MEQIIEYLEKNKERCLEELTNLLAIPSISTNPVNKSDIERCCSWLSEHMLNIGIENVRIIPTEGHPIIYGDWLHANNKPTILIYGHYDVQPVDPVDLWSSPPFKATIRGDNLYARGASDDKGQLFIHLKGIEAYNKIYGGLPLNVKIILEGEEEIGSEHLPAFIKENKELLKADLVVISDTSMFAKGVPSICYGLRGLSYLEVDIVGPNRDLHSGSYGGSVHNPIQVLTEIISQLHDKNGRITIPDFYDDVRPLMKREREAYGRLPWSDKKYADDLNVKKLYGEKGYTTLERLWARPALDCNGIYGGFTGEGAKTVIPSKASAKISMRLVPDQKPEKIAKLFEKYIKTVTPKTVKVKVRALHSGEPVITPIDSPGVQAAITALEKGFGKKPLYQREGGSIPIVVKFKQILGIDSVLLGFGLPDENAHAPDEFINLSNFFNGIRTVVYFYKELPDYYQGRKQKQA